jgi:phage-related protein
MPEKQDCLTNMEMYVSRDAEIQYAETASGFIPFDVQGFVQAINQVNVTILKSWLEHATWTRIKPRLDWNTIYKALMSNNNSKRVQVHGEPKNKLGGHSRKVNTVK